MTKEDIKSEITILTEYIQDIGDEIDYHYDQTLSLEEEAEEYQIRIQELEQDLERM